MRPDRIIVGEVRGAETLDMLQAMNTGHDGSLTTVHANSARDALHRLEMLVLMAGVELPVKAIREQIAGGFDLLVHISRLVDGSRRVTQITEIAGMEGDVVTLQDLFVARRARARGSDAARRCSGRSARPALRPGFLSKLAANGVELPPSTWLRPHEARRVLAVSPRLALVAAGGGGRVRRRSQIRRRRPRRVPASSSVTAVVPAGSRPTLLEDGRPAESVDAQDARLGAGDGARRRQLASR